MFDSLNLITLLLAPVIAYLVGVFVFAFYELFSNEQSLPVKSSTQIAHNGQSV